MAGGSVESDALWLATLHRICGRAAHEMKGALNGVSVNLEVVRSRSEKPEAPASSVSKFANSAAGQLEAVITMTDALLALTRPAREPVDVSRVVVQVGALLVPAARADSRQLSIERGFDDGFVTSAAGSAVRAVIGGCLLAAIDASTDVRCGRSAGALPARLHVESCDGSELSVAPELVAVAIDAGIHIAVKQTVITVSFPFEETGISESA